MKNSILLLVAALFFVSCSSSDDAPKCAKITQLEEVKKDNVLSWYLVLDDGYREQVDYKTFINCAVGYTRCR